MRKGKDDGGVANLRMLALDRDASDDKCGSRST